ncbi:MAG: sialidase family protein [Pirellulales bacterium]
MKRRDFLRTMTVASIPPSVGWRSVYANEDAPQDTFTGQPLPLALDIKHAKKTTPISGAKFFAMPHPGSRTDTRTAMTSAGDIYVCGGGYLWKSTDRGETWSMSTLPHGTGGGFGILSGDVFILLFDDPESATSFVLRSTDFGKTWSNPQPLDIRPFDVSGGGWSHVYQHPDGTAMITLTLRHRKQNRFFHDHIFRSTDGGLTWGDRTLLVPYSAESSLLALCDSKRMLTYIRAQRPALPEDPPDFWKQTGATEGHPWPLKNGVVAESNDGGRTWKNLRLFDTYGSVPGEIIQVPDGRVAAVWLQRYPYQDSEIRVRISSDDGRTWEKRTYSLFKAHGYPSSVVYSDGTIVTVCEDTKMDNRGQPRGKRSLAAVRWHFPENG